MPYKNLIDSPERVMPRIVNDQSSLVSAQSSQGGLHPIPQLQRKLGNRHIAQLIQARRLTPDGRIIGLQRKLTVGAADDQYEQEADRVARQVMNTPDAAVAKSMQRAMSPEEDKDKMLQTKPLAAAITPFVQRDMVSNEKPEEETPIQATFLTGTSRQSLQRQPEEDKDKMLQTKPLAADITSFAQRDIVSNEKPEEETPVQARFLSETSRQSLQRQPEEDKDKTVQAKSAGSMSDSFEAGADVETQVNQSKGRGSPLPAPVRAYMEPRFGVEFSHVRVHTGSDALQMTRTVGAQAFTHGSDIYYGAGSSPTNLELTAHELTHVVQQTGGAPLQTKNLEDEAAPRGSEPAIQRICAACAAEENEKKGAETHIARVRQTSTESRIQGKWNFAGVKHASGGDEGDSTSGNGSIFPSLSYADQQLSYAGARAYTRQKLGLLKSSYGGRAKAFRWITSEYTFKNDHSDADFLTLSGKGSISGWAKAEDLEYARGAALIVGRITENPHLNKTSSELFSPLKEGGISAASVGDLGEIGADVPIGGGSVNVTIPLTKVKEGTQAPINDNNSPSYNVPNSVDEVDITIIVRADADADIEDEVWGGLLASGDENTAKVAASFFLDWKSRPGSGALTSTSVTAQKDKLSYPGDCKRNRLINAANKDGCSTEEGAKHTKVNKNGAQITTIPRDVKENNTCRSIIKILNDECLQ